jgi:molybdenum cofactor guanylyltransferase
MDRRPPAVILAGGGGRRMGGADKAFLTLAGRPLLAHVLDRLAPQAVAVAVSANGDPARFAAYGLPVLPDDTPLGPLAGVLAGLRWARQGGADTLLAVPVDAPFLPSDLAAFLAPAPALARTSGGVQGTFALWPVAAEPALAAFLDSGAKPKVTDFAAGIGARFVDFPDPAAFANLNTPADLAAAEGRFR